jgi:hypothetical protein
MFNFVFDNRAVYEIMWKNYCRLSEYVIIIDSPLQQWLYEGALSCVIRTRTLTVSLILSTSNKKYILKNVFIYLFPNFRNNSFVFTQLSLG